MGLTYRFVVLFFFYFSSCGLFISFPFSLCCSSTSVPLTYLYLPVNVLTYLSVCSYVLLFIFSSGNLVLPFYQVMELLRGHRSEEQVINFCTWWLKNFDAKAREHSRAASGVFSSSFYCNDFTDYTSFI